MTKQKTQRRGRSLHDIGCHYNTDGQKRNPLVRVYKKKPAQGITEQLKAKNALEWNRKKACLFHLEMWIYVHGMATMLATSYLELDEAFISKVLTDGYKGMKTQFIRGKPI